MQAGPVSDPLWISLPVATVPATHFPPAERDEQYTCETPRHADADIPAMWLQLLYGPHPVHHMEIYRAWMTCQECHEGMKAVRDMGT